MIEWFKTLRLIIHAELYGRKCCIHEFYDMKEEDCNICNLNKRIDRRMKNYEEHGVYADNVHNNKVISNLES